MGEVMNNDLAIYGHDLFGDPIVPPSRGKLSDSFVVPPFSVLNAREGFWQERKAAWIAMGIKSEVGRGNANLNMSHPETTQTIDFYARKRAIEVQQGRTLSKSEAAEAIAAEGKLADQRSQNRASFGRAFGQVLTKGENRNFGSGDHQQETTGASVFDPVLTELAYRWFCPEGGSVLDPFAGGSVRGIVAAQLGRRYFGVELRPEQIESNRSQAAAICSGAVKPVWIEGDSCDIDHLESAPVACDFVFSCPPYADLERYSDDSRDLSTMEYHTFIPAYRLAILKACKRLRQDRFAAFVVGDIRDRKGNYRNFVSDTITAFQLAGLQLYNEAILVTAVGSLPVRVPKQFAASRKLGKTHQNVLVFVKGSGKAAAKICGKVPE